jgi:hypothetical protein
MFIIISSCVRMGWPAGMQGAASRTGEGGGFEARAVQWRLGWDCTAEAAAAVHRFLCVSGRTCDVHGEGGDAAPSSRTAGFRGTGVQVLARTQLPLELRRRRLNGALPYYLCRVPRMRARCPLTAGCLVRLSQSSCKECALLANRSMHVALHSNATGCLSGVATARVSGPTVDGLRKKKD